MEFFIIKDKKQRGPYTLEQLAEMGITSDTPVWHEGLGPWKPAWQVEPERQRSSLHRRPFRRRKELTATQEHSPAERKTPLAKTASAAADAP